MTLVAVESLVQGLLLWCYCGKMKGTEKCQVCYNGLVMEKCKVCSDGGGMEVYNVCCNGTELEKCKVYCDGVAAEQHSSSG